MQLRHLIVAFVALAGATAGSAQNSYWIAAAAHASGVGDSVWRTDVAVVNLEGAPATIDLCLHHANGTDSAQFVVGPHRQQVFVDAVAQLAAGEIVGSIEIASDRRLATVRSRTYNLADSGSFGQALDGVSPLLGLGDGERARLVQLREDNSFRSNVGGVNVGDETARLQVELFDAAGAEVGTFVLEVPPGRQRQDGRSFASRFGRSDIVCGSAELTVLEGGPVYAYGSVIDNATGDPTTISMEPIVSCPE